LMRWLGGYPARRPLLIIGVIEIVAGQLFLLKGGDWRGEGHFLMGIGGVVLLAGLVWVRNAPAPPPLPGLGWAAFWLVQLQGLLGGLRVVLDSHLIADVRLGVAFGIVHGCLGQAFLVLMFVIALFTSRAWQTGKILCSREGGEETSPTSAAGLLSLRWLFLAITGLVFLQLILGATMRHQHAGLAIPDFPLAYGRLWPAMDAESVALYNARRVEITAANPITAFQVSLQMGHRIVAIIVLGAVAALAWRARKCGGLIRRLAWGWAGLLLLQAALGAWTIWSNKAADVATLHVLGGALSLVTGALASIICFRRFSGMVTASDTPVGEISRTEPVPATANS